MLIKPKLLKPVTDNPPRLKPDLVAIDQGIPLNALAKLEKVRKPVKFLGMAKGSTIMAVIEHNGVPSIVPYIDLWPLPIEKPKKVDADTYTYRGKTIIRCGDTKSGTRHLYGGRRHTSRFVYIWKVKGWGFTYDSIRDACASIDADLAKK